MFAPGDAFAADNETMPGITPTLAPGVSYPDPDLTFLEALRTGNAPADETTRVAIGLSLIERGQRQTFLLCAAAGYFSERNALTCKHRAPFAAVWRRAPSLAWWPVGWRLEDVDVTGLWMENPPSYFSPLTADPRCPVCREWGERGEKA